MKQKFNVLVWNFNTDTIEHYDVLPYFRNRYKERVERNRKYSNSKYFDSNDRFNKIPKTFEEFKQFITDESLYNYWSRCEYEMICHGWPVQRNNYKLDAHEQIMMNIDIITEILLQDYND